MKYMKHGTKERSEKTKSEILSLGVGDINIHATIQTHTVMRQEHNDFIYFVDSKFCIKQRHIFTCVCVCDVET